MVLVFSANVRPVVSHPRAAVRVQHSLLSVDLHAALTMLFVFQGAVTLHLSVGTAFFVASHARAVGNS